MTKSTTTTLLSKFSHLFRKPSREEVVFTPTDSFEVPRETGESLKQKLKSKRRNDAIRSRELNRLRAIIQSGRVSPTSDLIGVVALTAHGRSSGMGSLERTSILNKIDGAEAHLDQWWGAHLSKAAPLHRASAPDSGPTAPAPLEEDDLELDFTGAQSLSEDEPMLRYPASGPVPFSDDALAVTPVDYGLRDAALLYAEGEFAAAESALSSLLADPNVDSDAAEELTFSLFDVYRCSGQQERFEELALDYASRFGRSPAEWFSLDDETAATTTTAQTEVTVASTAQQSIWNCPAVLDAQALADCTARLQASNQACTINWASLQHIDANTAPAFAKQVEEWCGQPVELRWLGTDCLMAALHMCRISDQVSGNEPWWLIELDMLCLLQQLHAFEELALEYCMAFEVSPPHWKTVACKLAPTDDVSEPVTSVTTEPSRSLEIEPKEGYAYVQCALGGNILGDIPSTLDVLQEASLSAKLVTVTCSRLGRIDIDAAGKLLNWAAQFHAHGCKVQFTCVPRLVLVYFHMLGLHRLASLSAGPY